MGKIDRIFYFESKETIVFGTYMLFACYRLSAIYRDESSD